MTPLLVASSAPEIVRRADAVVGELDAVEIVAHAADGQILGSLIERYQPEVVLLDENLGPIPAVELTRSLSRAYPGVGIVLLVARDDTDGLRKALTAGARAALVAEFDLTMLQGAIDAAAGWITPQLPSEVSAHNAVARHPVQASKSMLALAGAKGGVGVTTIAIGLAQQVMVSRPSSSVCIVDFDLLCGDLPTFLDLDHGRSVTDLLGVAGEATSRHLDESLYRHESGLRVLLAPPHGEDGEDVTAESARQILQAIRARFDVVIVDCGAVLNEAGSAAVELADQVVIVATPDVPAMLGARRQRDLWQRLGLRAVDEAQVVLNRVGRRDELQPKLIDQIVGISRLKAPVPARFRSLEAAMNRRAPHPSTDRKFGKAVLRVAEELGLAGDGSPAPPAPRPQPTTPAVATPAVATPPGAPRSTEAPQPVALAQLPPVPPTAAAVAARALASHPVVASGGRQQNPLGSASGLTRRMHGSRGQAALESAGALFAVLLLILGLLQIVVAGYALNAAGESARAGARAAAIGETVEVDADALAALPNGWSERATIENRSGRGTARVTVEIAVPLLITSWDTPLTVSSTASLVLEDR